MILKLSDKILQSLLYPSHIQVLKISEYKKNKNERQGGNLKDIIYGTQSQAHFLLVSTAISCHPVVIYFISSCTPKNYLGFSDDDSLESLQVIGFFMVTWECTQN
jgi:hypothetical protein